MKKFVSKFLLGPKLVYILKEQEKDIILSEKVSDAMVPKYFFDLSFRVEIPTREQWSTGDLMEYPDALKYYHDGSKTKDGTGFGVHGAFEISRNMSNLATVFQAEAKALATCAKHIFAQNVEGRNIIIYSDSQSLLKALSKHKVISKCVYECKTYLEALGEKNFVKVIWIPGHEGYVGNEKADVLAKRGAANVQDLYRVQCELSTQVSRARIKSCLTDAATSEWTKKN